MASVSVGAALIPVVQVYAQDDKRSLAYSASEGQVGKRYGMVIDSTPLRGLQACTVACTIENQPP